MTISIDQYPIPLAGLKAQESKKAKSANSLVLLVQKNTI